MFPKSAPESPVAYEADETTPPQAASLCQYWSATLIGASLLSCTRGYCCVFEAKTENDAFRLVNPVWARAVSFSIS